MTSDTAGSGVVQVKFVGEEGVDEGGVQKEFFQLLVSVWHASSEVFASIMPSSTSLCLPRHQQRISVAVHGPAACWLPRSRNVYKLLAPPGMMFPRLEHLCIHGSHLSLAPSDYDHMTAALCQNLNAASWIVCVHATVQATAS